MQQMGYLKHRFVMRGDYNAKYTHWGSILTTTKGNELLNAINQKGMPSSFN